MLILLPFWIAGMVKKKWLVNSYLGFSYILSCLVLFIDMVVLFQKKKKAILIKNGSTVDFGLVIILSLFVIKSRLQ